MTDLQWARVSNDAFDVALFAYLASMLGYFVFLAFKRDGIWQVSRAVAVVGVAANLVSIVARGLSADRVPWGNMYEYSSLLAMLVVVGALVVVEGVYKVRSLTGFALMFSVLTMAVAVSFLYVGPGPLVPALNSYWIKIHVQAAIWGSSLFALGGIATIAYLVVDRSERRGSPRSARARLRRSWAARSTSSGCAPTHAPDDLVPDSAEDVATRPSSRRLVPSAAGLDRLAYRIIAVAFPIWTFAVIAGAIWAQEAWGRYWGWDPKETWSFITWVDLRRLPARARHQRMEGPPRRRHRARRLRLAADHVLRREPLDRGSAQLCEVTQ